VDCESLRAASRAAERQGRLIAPQLSQRKNPMENLVLYAVENGVHRPLLSVSPDDESKFFLVSARGAEFAREKAFQGVAVPPLQLVREVREADADGRTLTKQEFTLLDPATFAPRGKPVKELSKLLTKGKE
jgi:hypothetical protein